MQATTVPAPSTGLLASTGLAAASNDEAYLDELVARARKLRLASSRQWRRMGHWQQGTLTGFQSQADGRGFFLSERGKHDPGAELEATLRAFFAPGTGNDHAICKFPARFLWLGKQLGFDAARFGDVRCPRLEKFLASLAPQSATVVFSAYYLGAPASAFGHTLLRINKKTVLGEGPRRELLDTGINYSATVDTGNVLIYAIKGMAGSFRGEFSRMPYYYKVREYNDFESRDLWEYELDLSPESLAILVAHIWELGSTYFDYFYLSENCSYHILAALEVADPDLELLSHIKYPVIPGDTIKALYANPKLVRNVDYRPSLRSQFRARLDGLDGDEKDLVVRLADHPDAAIPADVPLADQAKMLDAAVDLLDLQYTEEIVMQRTSPESRRRQALLERRSRLVVASDDLALDAERRAMPHLAHGSRRVELGGGASVDDGAFVQLGFRIALHDLADSPIGYPELSEIQFLPTTARFYVDEQKFSLERISLIRIAHLVPMSRFQLKLSWNIDVGGMRLRDDGCDDCFAGRVEVGPGAAFEFARERFALFAFLDNTLEAAPDMVGPIGAVRLGGGPAGGVRVRFHDRVIGLARGALHYFPWQDSGLVWSATATLRWNLLGPLALDVGANAFVDAMEARASVMAYY